MAYSCILRYLAGTRWYIGAVLTSRVELCRWFRDGSLQRCYGKLVNGVRRHGSCNVTDIRHKEVHDIGEGRERSGLMGFRDIR